MSELLITPATDNDFDAIWKIFKDVTAPGDSYIYPEDFTKEQIYAIWMKETAPYVAKIGDEIVGTYLIRQNRIGRGSHVCNAAYMVKPSHQNNKIGRKMGEHSLIEAKRMGYLAMQFNIVVSTNERAVYLWQSLGFKIVGTIPKAFNHKEKGLVDAYVMHQFL
jgi:ribosomal protein S18 acetylase RimI-like enzyme